MDCERVAYTEGLAAGLELALAGVNRSAPPGPFAAVPGADGEIDFVPCDGRGSMDPSLAVRLAAVRIGVTRKLLDHAVEHLSGRVTGGEPTIRKQMVRGTIADALMNIEMLRQYLEPPYRALVDAHDQITALGWEVIKLLGASGYLAAGPADEVRRSELVANCWIDREDGSWRRR